MYSRVRNKHTPTFVDFPGAYGLITDLKDYIRLHIFNGLCLFFLSNFPEATLIQGATFIPDSRVGF